MGAQFIEVVDVAFTPTVTGEKAILYDGTITSSGSIYYYKTKSGVTRWWDSNGNEVSAPHTITVSSADTSKGTVSGTTVFYYFTKASSQTVEITTTCTPISGYVFDSYTTDVGTISGTTLTIPANTSSNISVSAVFEEYVPNRVGGRIFYIDSSATGATYTFYDSSMNEITGWSTVSDLANAYYYEKTGTGSADKFYVYDNENGLATDMEWGAYGTSVGITTDGIGYGKTNTATALNNSACFTPYTSGNTTIWTWLRDSINANKVGGCNDWFIASKAEQDELANSGLVDWYEGGYIIWSSVEYASGVAWFWNYLLWFYFNKATTSCVFACRAF